jgi:hypothetical protein
MDTYQATEGEIARTYFLALLAEAYGKVGQAEACPERSRREGLTLLAEALATVDKSGERMYEAELYRLKGELLRQKAKACPELSRRGKNQKAKVKRNRRLKLVSTKPLTLPVGRVPGLWSCGR